MCVIILKLLEKEIKKNSSKISILVKELNSKNIIYKYNADKQFVSASTIKVFILLTALNEVKKGNIILDTVLDVPKKEILEGTKVFEHGPTKCSLEELLNWMSISELRQDEKVREYIKLIPNLELITRVYVQMI